MHERANMTRAMMAGLCLAVLGVGLVWPVALTVRGAFVGAEGGWTAGNLSAVFIDPVQVGGLVNSAVIAFLTTVVSLGLALPLALVNERCEFPGRRLWGGLVLVPLILPPFVGAIGLRGLLGRYGAVNALLEWLGWMDWSAPMDWLGGGGTWSVAGGLIELDGRLAGIVLVEALHLFPIVYLNVSAALANVDPAMEQAASNLGAGRWRRLWRVTGPLIRPGVFAGCTIVFIWSFTELGTPLMFDYTQVTPVQVFWGIQEMDSSARPYALVVVLLAVTMLLYGGGKWAFGGRGYAGWGRIGGTMPRRRLRGAGKAAAVGLFVAVVGVALLPHVGVIMASLSEPGTWYRSIVPGRWTGGHYSGALTHALAGRSIANSLVYSLGAMGLDVVVGMMVAVLVVRLRGGRWLGRWVGRLLDGLAMAPLAVPGLVMAFGYVAVSLQIGQWFERAGMRPPSLLQVLGQNPDPALFLVVAYAVRRLPYVVRSAVAGLEQVPVELEEAAQVLGAGRWRVLVRVVVPLVMASLVAGGLLAFSFAMLEVSDSLILAQTAEHYPITRAIYTLYERLGDGPYIASAMGVWGMVLLGLTMVGASMMLGRRMGTIFRV